MVTLLAPSTAAALAVFPAFLFRPLPKPTPPPEPEPFRVVRVRSGSELKAASLAAARFGLDVCCPTFLASWSARGRAVSVEVPYLRRAFLARFPADDAPLWHALRALDGVLGFIGGPRPSPVPATDVARFLAWVSATRSRHLATPTAAFERGQEVRVATGPFASYAGVVSRIASPSNLEVKIFGLLSHDAVITVPAGCCEPIETADTTPSLGIPHRRGRRAKRGHDRSKLEVSPA